MKGVKLDYRNCKYSPADLSIMIPVVLATGHAIWHKKLEISEVDLDVDWAGEKFINHADQGLHFSIGKNFEWNGNSGRVVFESYPVISRAMYEYNQMITDYFWAAFNRRHAVRFIRKKKFREYTLSGGLALAFYTTGFVVASLTEHL